MLHIICSKHLHDGQDFVLSFVLYLTTITKPFRKIHWLITYYKLFYFT